MPQQCRIIRVEEWGLPVFCGPVGRRGRHCLQFPTLDQGMEHLSCGWWQVGPANIPSNRPETSAMVCTQAALNESLCLREDGIK